MANAKRKINALLDDIESRARSGSKTPGMVDEIKGLLDRKFKEKVACLHKNLDRVRVSGNGVYRHCLKCNKWFDMTTVSDPR